MVQGVWKNKAMWGKCVKSIDLFMYVFVCACVVCGAKKMENV